MCGDGAPSLKCGRDVRNYRAQKPDELAFDTFGDFQDLRMNERLIENTRSGIGDARNSQHANARMTRCDYLWHRRHADQIRTDGTEVANLCRSFVTRTRERRIHAFPHTGAEAAASAKSSRNLLS